MPGPVASQEPQRDVRLVRAADNARHLLAGVLEGSGAPGFSIAVVVDGRPVWAEGFGFADLEARARATSTTLYRVGSISKSFTAVGIGLLAQRGRLDLDAPVERYIPGAPAAWDRVTTRAIGGHLAGFRHYRVTAEMLRTERFPSVASSLRLIRDEPLIHEPGTEFSYSSYAWTVASAVMEGASGTPFLDFMTREVFAPMRLARTRADFPDSVLVGRSRFYQLSTGGVTTHAPYIDNSWVWAGGGFLSSAGDVAMFGSSAVLGTMLSTDIRAALFRPQRDSRGRSTRYGIGWFVETDALGRRMIGHDGESIGGSASLRVFPDERVSIAMLDNLTDGPSSRLITDAIADIFIRARQPRATSLCVPPRVLTLGREAGNGLELRFDGRGPRGAVNAATSPVDRIGGRYSCLDSTTIRAVAYDRDRALTVLLIKERDVWRGMAEWRDSSGDITRHNLASDSP